MSTFAMSRNKQPVLIAGGGIGGLSCALALARKGFRSVVLEQARQFGEIGVGLHVAPNALNVLRVLGVEEAAKRNALLIERILLRDSISGDTIVDIECGDEFVARFGNHYAVAHRADIHGALLNACRADAKVELRTEAQVTDWEIRDAGVTATLLSGDRVNGDALVGADGIDSNTRKILLNDGDPVPCGAVIYRAVIAKEDMPDDLRHPYPTLWAGPGTHLIYYPIRDWRQFNVGATVVTGARSVDPNDEAPPTEVLEHFRLNCEIPLRVLSIPRQFKRWLIRHREPVDNWTRGPVTLLGDAAHPMVQYAAQGAAQALEDSICLAAATDQADGDFPAAFQKYQAIRIVRSARVQISSMMLDIILHAGGVRRLVRNSIFEGRTQKDHYDRLSWLYKCPDYGY
jgi:3-hydroxybenzoate 6-monooxygenase